MRNWAEIDANTHPERASAAATARVRKALLHVALATRAAAAAGSRSYCGKRDSWQDHGATATGGAFDDDQRRGNAAKNGHDHCDSLDRLAGCRRVSAGRCLGDWPRGAVRLGLAGGQRRSEG